MSVTASATSAATSAVRRRSRATPEPDLRPPSRITPCRSVRAARSAGTRPKITALATVRATANVSTTPSTLVWKMRGNVAGPDAASSCVAQVAIITPPSAPAAESTRLSASSWRTIRHRLAPSAARTASSRARPVPRASRRLATLAHAMSSTHATAPSQVNSRRRTSATSQSV